MKRPGKVVHQKAVQDAPETINALIADLTCDDVMKCQKARRTLVAKGSQSVAALTEALSSHKPWVRWEAAKALGQIGDPAAIQALLKAVKDQEFDVRWQADEALVSIGRKAVVPLLRALLKEPDSLWMRQSAHHVLHDIRIRKDLFQVLKPVLAALEGIAPAVEVPLAVGTALRALTRKEESRPVS